MKFFTALVSFSALCLAATHAWCADAGVPILALNQDGSKYFDYHHTSDDTLDKIDRDALSQNVTAWVTLIWLAADSDVDFRALAQAAPATP